ncbi:hypothetical protein JMJ56_22585 [Belnapia sp. T18]|uniref:Uncharacterized protein n=1 Tax=Belnapia arida TaxID=2804533 RepID=A0ABS1U804_9PROT|nr:hypothetical protein [Belnapia arida]MBL6080806.1 hypothetical protein [Belnapia arida]
MSRSGMHGRHLHQGGGVALCYAVLGGGLLDGRGRRGVPHGGTRQGEQNQRE